MLAVDGAVEISDGVSTRQLLAQGESVFGYPEDRLIPAGTGRHLKWWWPLPVSRGPCQRTTSRLVPAAAT